LKQPLVHACDAYGTRRQRLRCPAPASRPISMTRTAGITGRSAEASAKEATAEDSNDDSPLSNHCKRQLLQRQFAGSFRTAALLQSGMSLHTESTAMPVFRCFQLQRSSPRRHGKTQGRHCAQGSPQDSNRPGSPPRLKKYSRSKADNKNAKGRPEKTALYFIGSLPAQALAALSISSTIESVGVAPASSPQRPRTASISISNCKDISAMPL